MTYFPTCSERSPRDIWAPVLNWRFQANELIDLLKARQLGL